MARKAPDLNEWRKLYAAATEIMALAPWEWMNEDAVFGVQNPETGEIGFVSVMGSLGEHLSIAVYLGDEGLYGFWEVEGAGPYDPPEKILEVPHLQASFENRTELDTKDRATIRKLNLKFRGQNAWPKFRSYRPGYFPWFLEADDARLLRYALEQTLDITTRYSEDSELLDSRNEDNEYLMRVPSKDGDSLVWEDQYITVPPPEVTPIEISMDKQTLEKLRRLPRGKNIVEIDFFLFLEPIQDKKNTRPYFPYTLMLVDKKSNFILDTKLLHVKTSLEAMWGYIPSHIVRALANKRISPRTIRVRSDLLMLLLQPLAKDIGFKLEQSYKLPSLDKAKNSMLNRFM